jgi:hypothetical protein
MLRYFRRKDQQPSDRASLVHGDFKIDNLLFHKTEPRVIAILDWEMSTVGHPLSDLVNLISPWYWTRETIPSPEAQLARYEGRNAVNPFENEIPGLPKVDDVISWYIEESGYTDTSKELPWAVAFGAFRGAIVTQGIAARYARRQTGNFLARNFRNSSNHTPIGHIHCYHNFQWGSYRKLMSRSTSSIVAEKELVGPSHYGLLPLIYCGHFNISVAEIPTHCKTSCCEFDSFNDGSKCFSAPYIG